MSFLRAIYNVVPFKKELFSLLKQVYVPPPSLYRHLIFKGKFKISLKDTHFWMNHYGLHGFIVEDALFWKGIHGYEEASINIWIKLCKDAKVIMDIGANTGLFSLVAEASQPTSEIHGFEPSQKIFEKYVANIAINNFKIRAWQLGLSNTPGELEFYEVESANNTYSATLSKEFADERHRVHQQRKITKVPVTTLEAYATSHNIQKIDLIKMDVETHEPEVIEGMGRYLEDCPTMLIEVMNEVIAEKITALIYKQPYLYFSIEENGSIQQQPKIIAPYRTNYLICTEAVAQRLALRKPEK